MNNFRLIISAITERISDVIHIGAGHCTETDLYHELGIQSITLIEPDAQLVNIARRKFSDSPSVNILQNVIARKAEQRVYFQISNKRFSSLLEPNKLFKYFPNLAITGQKEVKAITLASLCDEILQPTQANNLLVLELQGEETDVLINTPANVLHKFKWIVVRSSDEQLYGTAEIEPAAEIVVALQAASFDAMCFNEDAPPFQNYLFIRNDAEIANQTLVDKADSLQIDFADTQTANQALLDQINSLQKEFADAQTANQALVHQVDAQQKEFADAQTANQALLDQINSLQKDFADAQTANQALVHQVDAQQKEFAAAEIQYKQKVLSLDEACHRTQTELNEAQAQISALTAEKTLQSQQIEELRLSHSESVKELKEANHALRINNKLIAKTDADLRDLQARYQSAVENQQQQQALLVDLQQKLVQAANFYRQLDIQDRDIEGDIFSHDIESISNRPDHGDGD